MSRGYEQHRMERDGRWIYTGVLTDQHPFGLPDVRQPFHNVLGVNVPGKLITVMVPGEAVGGEGPPGAGLTASQAPVGTLGWVQYTRV